MEPAAQRRIGLPWSELFVERAYRVVRGTCEAAEAALQHAQDTGLSHLDFLHRLLADQAGLLQSQHVDFGRAQALEVGQAHFGV